MQGPSHPSQLDYLHKPNTLPHKDDIATCTCVIPVAASFLGQGSKQHCQNRPCGGCSVMVEPKQQTDNHVALTVSGGGARGGAPQPCSSLRPSSLYILSGLAALIIVISCMFTSSAGQQFVDTVQGWRTAAGDSRGSFMPVLPRLQLQGQVSMHQLKQHKQQAGPFKGSFDQACEAMQGDLHVPSNDSGVVAPVVVMGHNRPDYLTRTIGNLMGIWSQDPKNAERFLLYLSIDGSDTPTLTRVAELCSDHAFQIQALNHQHSQDKDVQGYARVADHFKWILRVFFECHQSPRLIFLEDDMLIAPDFFSYFNALAPLMELDNTTWCISCWNDNAQPNLVESSTRLYRTDYFPGLGWMTNREKGLHMINLWPRQYWDEHLRRNHGSFQCIYPEVSRTHTFGAEGTGGGAYYRDILSTLRLNTEPVQWEQQDLTYLLPDRYSNLMDKWLQESQLATVTEVLDLLKQTEVPALTAYKIAYVNGSRQSFEQIVKQIDNRTMTDDIGGWPRTAWQGIVVLHIKGHRVMLVPAANSSTTVV